MEIQSTTLYTKERLLRYNDYIALTKRLPHWIILLIGNLLIFLPVFLGAMSDIIFLGMIIAAICDALLLFCYFLLPRIMVRKAKSLGVTFCYTFEEDQLLLSTQNDDLKENSSFKYSFFPYIEKKGDVLYLFITRYQGFIVDLSALSAEELAQLHALFQKKIPSKKLKWKD